MEYKGAYTIKHQKSEERNFVGYLKILYIKDPF